MIIKANNSKFEACPEYTGKGVCVDGTPLRKQQSQFGEREVFKLVFEVDLLKTDGSRYCVWSRQFTPSTNEKANFRKFLHGWFGRDLTRAELDDFDTDSLIGKPAQLVVVQEHKDGETYANIVACTPDKSGEPLKPSGKYVRVKDRPPRDGGGAGGTGGGAGGTGDGAGGTGQLSRLPGAGEGRQLVKNRTLAGLGATVRRAARQRLRPIRGSGIGEGRCGPGTVGGQCSGPRGRCVCGGDPSPV